jgi:hypothetical protein
MRVYTILRSSRLWQYHPNALWKFPSHQWIRSDRIQLPEVKSSWMRCKGEVAFVVVVPKPRPITKRPVAASRRQIEGNLLERTCQHGPSLILFHTTCSTTAWSMATRIQVSKSHDSRTSQTILELRLINGLGLPA